MTNKESLAKWRRENPEKYRAQKEKYRKRDKELRAASRLKNMERFRNIARVGAARRRLEHPEKIRSQKRAWRKKVGYREIDRQEKRRYYERHSVNIRSKVLARYHKMKQDDGRWQKHCKQRAARLKIWRRANPQKVREAGKRWVKKNPHKARALWLRRHTKKKNAPGKHTVRAWIDRVRFYGWKCVYCGVHLTVKTLTKDHRIPIANGGTDFASNLVPACRSCNSRKGNRWVTEVFGK